LKLLSAPKEAWMEQKEKKGKFGPDFEFEVGPKLDFFFGSI
jgi:hypothetical protein